MRWFLAGIALLMVAGTVVYLNPMVEERKVIMQVVALGPVYSGDTSPRWIMFYGELGSRLVIDRLELTDSSAIWEGLKEGDEVALYHHFEYWSLFDKVIKKNHTDKLLSPP